MLEFVVGRMFRVKLTPNCACGVPVGNFSQVNFKVYKGMRTCTRWMSVQMSHEPVFGSMSRVVTSKPISRATFATDPVPVSKSKRRGITSYIMLQITIISYRFWQRGRRSDIAYRPRQSVECRSDFGRDSQYFVPKDVYLKKRLE